MDFQEIAKFNSTLDAETAGHTLDKHNIPFVIKGNESLIGEGPSTMGVSLWVAQEHVKKAHEILESLIPPTDADPAGSNPSF